MTEAAMKPLGDVGLGKIKPSVRTADHNGWYLLNGRALTALPAAAQMNAAAIALTSLVTAADRTLRDGGTSAFGTTGGADSVTLTQANMPNYTLSGSLDTQTNNHKHTISNWNNVQTNSGNKAGEGTPGSGGGGTGTLSIQSGGAHTHSFTVGTGGSAQAIDIQDPYLGVNWFIYLGA